VTKVRPSASRAAIASATTSRSLYSVALTTTQRRSRAEARTSRTRAAPPSRMSASERDSTSLARTAPPERSSRKARRSELVNPKVASRAKSVRATSTASPPTRA
jgi:hypothetical protein